MNKNKTELVLVLDRSASMQNCVKETESGAAELIQDQRSQPGEVAVSYYRFDSSVEKVYEGVDINEIGAIKVEPRGMTALYDGIGTAIDETGKRLARLPEDQRPGLVIVAIMTDGGENSSCKYTHQTVKQKIEHQTDKYSWQFMFLGANQDSFLVGGNLGIDASKISNYSTNMAQMAFNGTSDVIKAMRGVTAHGGGLEAVSACGYSDESREAMSEDFVQKNVGKKDEGIVKRAINNFTAKEDSGSSKVWS